MSILSTHNDQGGSPALPVSAFTSIMFLNLTLSLGRGKIGQQMENSASVNSVLAFIFL